jgi:hypothetical protein
MLRATHAAEAQVTVDQVPFYCRSKGTVGLSEEKWTLLIDSESGYRSVRHEWFRTNPLRASIPLFW